MAEKQTAVAFLVAGLQAWFTAQGLDTPIVFGRRAWAQQLNQGPGGANRIVIRDGNDGGSLGKISGALNMGDSPRNLRTFEHALEVSVWGVDSTAPNDELAQHEAAHLLFLWFVRALQDVSKADATLGEPRRLSANVVERSFGYAIAVPLVLRGTVPALADDIVHPTPKNPPTRTFDH